MNKNTIGGTLWLLAIGSIQEAKLEVAELKTQTGGKAREARLRWFGHVRGGTVDTLVGEC